MSTEVGAVHLTPSKGDTKETRLLPHPPSSSKSSVQLKPFSSSQGQGLLGPGSPGPGAPGPGAPAPGAVDARRASVHSVQAIASSLQSVFYPCQPHSASAGGAASVNVFDEEMKRSPDAETQRSASFSSESKAKPTDPRPVQTTGKSSSAVKISKTESLKVQKKHYRNEKKRAAEELLSTLKDPSIVILADWLKVRSSLKTWTKLWCVLKPGLIVLYKSNKSKSSHWVGTILLNACEILERPSKKDGFCFKVFHPLEQSIWATKGPKGESIGAITQPLPYSYLIFRAPSESAGKCWMDALELALRCSSLLIRTMAKEVKEDTGAEASSSISDNGSPVEVSSFQGQNGTAFRSAVPMEMNDSDCERHFYSCGMDDDSRTDREDKDEGRSDSETEDEEEDKKFFLDDNQPPSETNYVENAVEELGQQGDASQTEEVADENKSLIWMLVRQVRPGMDLSKVALPTFILEPRSFLDKLSDYYFHADLLSEAVQVDDPFTRFKMVVRWYMSGFYKKPKGLKKPYNPVLGEIFRCCWVHPQTNSRTFYIAEQVSHHPPVSAFYITNRQDGFVLYGSILAKSKFYGNSLSAILDGVARLTFLKRGEEYVVTMPYAHCRGILIGTLTMELGGVVTIHCEKTGYHAEIEFKLKPFLGSGEASNRICGKIRLGEETLATISGHWDQEILIKDKQSGNTLPFWNPTNEIKQKRLKRHTVPVESQTDFEAEKLWIHTSDAIIHGNQNQATNEKFILEDEQRKEARERKAKMEEWVPRFFERNLLTGEWIYKYADLRPWDPMNDIIQFEHNFVIQTKTKHQTPIVHTTSIVGLDEKKSRNSHVGAGASLEGARGTTRHKRSAAKHLRSVSSRGSGSSSAVPDDRLHRDSISSLSGDETIEPTNNTTVTKSHAKTRKFEESLNTVLKAQQETSQKLSSMQNQLATIQSRLLSENNRTIALGSREIFLLSFMLVAQLIVLWWLQNPN